MSTRELVTAVPQRRGSLGTGLEPDPGLVEQVIADLDAILSRGMRAMLYSLCADSGRQSTRLRPGFKATSLVTTYFFIIANKPVCYSAARKPLVPNRPFRERNCR